MFVVVDEVVLYIIDIELDDDMTLNEHEHDDIIIVIHQHEHVLNDDQWLDDDEVECPHIEAHETKKHEYDEIERLELYQLFDDEVDDECVDEVTDELERDDEIVFIEIDEIDERL